MTTPRTSQENYMTRNYSTNNMVGARYLNSMKKRYYLASADENIDLLIRQQKEDLTKVLIDLKSEYDKLTRETAIKKEETIQLQKKISILEQMDNRIKKNYEKSASENEVAKEAIELKQKKKEEESYSKKTFEQQIEKLKNDIFLIQKETILKQNETVKLDKIYEKERSRENDIRLKYNDTYSKILDQDKQNAFDKNEQDLQIQYYEQIIESKSSFIQSADDRKERQKRIAQEAKNDSQDKQEVERRRELELVMLYNSYLRKKMDNLLENSKKTEDIFAEIRTICGTASMKELVDFILNKEKRYNYSVQQAARLEKEKELLSGKIKDLSKVLAEIKNQRIIEENSNGTTNDITNEAHYTDESDTELLQKEKELESYLLKLQEKHKNVNLAYEKVIENINALCEFHNENYNHITEKNEQVDEYLKREAEAAKEDMQEEEKQEVKEENPAEAKENKEQKEETSKENEQPQQEIDASSPVAEKKPENDTGDLVDSTAPNNMKSSPENINTEQLPINVEQNEQEKDIVKNYHDFLDKTSKSFDILFLCHSKMEFLNLMRDKGIEMQGRETVSVKNGGKPRKNTRKKTRNEEAKEINAFDKDFEFDDDDLALNKKDDFILRDFKNKERKAREEYIEGEEKNTGNKKLPAIKKNNM